MVRLKEKDLPKLLRQAFEEEAQKIKLPSRQQLWTELQQRPGFAAIEKNVEQCFPQLTTQKRPGRGLYTFYKKHSPLAGLIAAGLLLAVLLSRSTLFMKQAGTLPQDQIPAPPEMSLQGEYYTKNQDDAMFITGEEKSETDESGIQKKFSLPGNVREGPLAEQGAGEIPPGSAEGTTLFVQDTEDNIQESDSVPEKEQLPMAFSLPVEEAPSPEKNIRNNQLGRSLQPIPEEQIFQDKESFLQALKKFRQLAAEEIWHVKSLPENFSFMEGTITRTEETVLEIVQVFAGKEGNEFTLIQQFIPEDEENETDVDLTFTQSLAQPMQVGPYRGYLSHPSPESCTLNWLQENSLVTLSGQLTEEMLREILTSLEPSPGE